jgi:hypothetical protein
MFGVTRRVTFSEIIIAVTIHLLVPLIGLVVFLLLCRRMSRRKIPSPPYYTYFTLFAAFGGWLLVLLTGLFWEWSGMASLGVFSLTLVFPIVTAFQSEGLRYSRKVSLYHQCAYAGCIAYSGLMLIMVVVVICINRFNS